jgi:pectate lyase
MTSKIIPALLLGLALLSVLVARVHATLLAHEPFTNSVGAAVIGSDTGHGFNGAWQANNSQGTATNTGFGLSYTDAGSNSLVTAGGAGFFQGLTSANNSMQPIRLFNFSRGTNGIDNTTTWISFLVARHGPTGTLSGNPYGRGANVPHDLNAENLQKLAIGNGSNAGSNTVALIPQGSGALIKGATNAFGGVTNFVVVRIDHVADGANDNAYLFVNPALNIEPSTNAAGAVSLNNFDFSFDRLRVFAGGQNSAAQPYAELVLDEYRIGESYADVAPFLPAPPVVTNVLLITNVTLISDYLVLSGTGGSNQSPYHLLGSPTLAIPSTNWPALATNNFDANGNFVLTNPVSSGSEAQFFRLRLALPVIIAPTISASPLSLTVTQGNNAEFTVTAAGTAPLSYQWYLAPSTPVPNALSDTLTITNAQTSDAGDYFVVVANGAGTATSEVATLTVELPSGLPDFSLLGFATVNGTVTGGSGGTTQTVTTATAFRNAVGTTSPGVVQVAGTIDLAGSATVRARKTIVGLGADAAIVGTLNISGTAVSNVIVRNLTISSPAGDGITIINGAHHIWVDHCTFFDCSDGQLDITQQADFVTVSWCKFNYTTNSGHNFSMLIGSSDDSIADRGKLNVTLHHNWWSTLAIERMPRVRFGDVHTFNNYFNAPGNNYCIRATLESEILIENNYFQNVDEPWTLFVTTSTNGLMHASGNVLVNCTSTNTPATDLVFSPPYVYSLRPALQVPEVVTNYAGVGRGPFAP